MVSDACVRVYVCLCVCVSVRWDTVGGGTRTRARARRARQVVRSHVRGSLLEVGEVGESKVVGSGIVISGRQWQEAEASRGATGLFAAKQ